MLNIYLRLKTQLHVLQLEEYNIYRYLLWNFRNPLTNKLGNKKPFIWTSKAKNIFFLSILYSLSLFILSIYYLKTLGLISILVLYLYFPLLVLACVSRKPYEFINRLVQKHKIKKKIIKLKSNGLQIIGITGSYGKTTTKEFLYTLLSCKYKVLKTPESYNTLFGIASVIELELDETYDFFICEIGAYKKGEIAEICSCVLPDHGILTGITEQHLERFGSLNNVIEAKFELIESVPKVGFKVLNAQNENIERNYKKYTSTVITYGTNNLLNTYRNVAVLNGKTSFDLVINNQLLHINDLNLFGEGNILNLLGASVLAKNLSVSLMEIKDSINKLSQPKHRLEVVEKANGITLIDDSYSSNIVGFVNAINFLNTFKGRPKVLVTPGIVELGIATKEKHVELGSVANNVCDFVILVGNNLRTDSLALSIDKEKVHFIKSIFMLNDKLVELNLIKPVVLIENDLPEHYV